MKTVTELPVGDNVCSIVDKSSNPCQRHDRASELKSVPVHWHAVRAIWGPTHCYLHCNLQSPFQGGPTKASDFKFQNWFKFKLSRLKTGICACKSILTPPRVLHPYYSQTESEDH